MRQAAGVADGAFVQLRATKARRTPCDGRQRRFRSAAWDESAQNAPAGLRRRFRSAERDESARTPRSPRRTGFQRANCNVVPPEGDEIADSTHGRSLMQSRALSMDEIALATPRIRSIAAWHAGTAGAAAPQSHASVVHVERQRGGDHVGPALQDRLEQPPTLTLRAARQRIEAECRESAADGESWPGSERLPARGLRGAADEDLADSRTRSLI